MEYASPVINKSNYKDVIKKAFIDKEGKENFKRGKEIGVTYRMTCQVAAALLQEQEAATLLDLANLIEGLSNAIALHEYIVAHGQDNYYWRKLISEHRQAEFEVARVEASVFLKPTELVLKEIESLEKENA